MLGATLNALNEEKGALTLGKFQEYPLGEVDRYLNEVKYKRRSHWAFFAVLIALAIIFFAGFVLFIYLYKKRYAIGFINRSGIREKFEKFATSKSRLDELSPDQSQQEEEPLNDEYSRRRPNAPRDSISSDRTLQLGDRCCGPNSVRAKYIASKNRLPPAYVENNYDEDDDGDDRPDRVVIDFDNSNEAVIVEEIRPTRNTRSVIRQSGRGIIRQLDKIKGVGKKTSTPGGYLTAN